MPLHMLKMDCKTRWGSTQLVLNHILKQKDAIKVLRADSKTRHLCSTWQHIDVLVPLDDFTDSLSGENSVTVSAINAVLHILKTDVLAV